MSERTIENLQLDGGCAVFDFTNTLNTRATSPAYDYLKSYQDILSWSDRARILSLERLRILSQYAAAHPEQRDVAFLKAIRVRETLYPMFSAIAHLQTPDKEIIDGFNTFLSECLGRIQLKISQDVATPGFINAALLDEPLCIIMKSAYDILTNENFRRLKECPRCGWLFVDRTKNGKRRWCDMKVCGSRSKATRYYHKKKDEAE